MENENKTVKPNEQPNEQPKEPQGWKDVNIVPDMPLSALIGFLNILNQRLVTVENLVPVKISDKEAISITEFYAQQEEEMRKNSANNANTENETKGE